MLRAEEEAAKRNDKGWPKQKEENQENEIPESLVKRLFLLL